ncbi:MAG: hypothetical protein AAF625_13875, partial [Pseudomonadota bacterium]
VEPASQTVDACGESLRVIAAAATSSGAVATGSGWPSGRVGPVRRQECPQGCMQRPRLRT